jgi:hypothetical protein
MNAIDPIVDKILASVPLSPLGPGTPHEEFRHALACLKLSPPVMAGLCLRCDLLHESHEISQELHTPEGSFWHAIMHRREPDAWNSKYWWRKVDSHPVLIQLVAKAPALGYKYTNPHDFVDFCERIRGSGSGEEDMAKRVQQLEWELLFNWCLNLN